MATLAFLALAAGGGFGTFYGVILLIVLFIFVVQIVYYMLSGFHNFIWKVVPKTWRETAEKYEKKRQDEIKKGVIKRPPYLSFKKQLYMFLIMLVFGAVGFALSLAIVFLLIPFGLPDIILKWICIVAAVVLSTLFMIRSVHYSCPEYENWVKKKYFSKKQKGQRVLGINTEEKEIIQNHMIAVVGKPIDCREEKFCPVSSIRPKRKFHFGIAEIMVKLGVACVFAVGGVIGAILCTFVFALFGTTNDTLVSITRILLCLLPTVMFFWSFKCT